MKNVNLFGTLALMCLAALAAGCGCSPEMAARDVTVTLDGSLRDSAGKLKSVQVDLIAVNAGEAERWKQENLNDYWTPGRSNIAGTADKYVMKFDAVENVTAKTLPKSDTHWTGWEAKQAMDLVVIADIPGYRGVSAGMADSRRLVLTLNRCRWDSTSAPIQINVSNAGLVAITQPKPEKQ